MELIAYREGVVLNYLEEPDIERLCVVCGVPGVKWEVALPGVHHRGYPEGYCALHEDNARAEFVSIAGGDAVSPDVDNREADL